MMTTMLLANLVAVLRESRWSLAAECGGCKGPGCSGCTYAVVIGRALRDHSRWIARAEWLVEDLHEVAEGLRRHLGNVAQAQAAAAVDLVTSLDEVHFEWLQWCEARDQGQPSSASQDGPAQYIEAAPDGELSVRAAAGIDAAVARFGDIATKLSLVARECSDAGLRDWIYDALTVLASCERMLLAGVGPPESRDVPGA
jgi:hypothetical protein